MIYSVIAIKLTCVCVCVCFIFCTIESTTFRNVRSPTWAALENIRFSFFLFKVIFAPLHIHCHCRMVFGVSMALCLCVCLALYNVCTAHHCFRITDLKWCTNNLAIVFILLLIFASIGLLPLLQLHTWKRRDRETERATCKADLRIFCHPCDLNRFHFL